MMEMLDSGIIPNWQMSVFPPPDLGHETPAEPEPGLDTTTPQNHLTEPTPEPADTPPQSESETEVQT